MMPRVSRRWVALAAIGFWALLVAVSLALNLSRLDQQAAAMAHGRAKMLFDLVETTRLWNARHGGVYVPVDDSTPPNPLLEDSDRDLAVGGRLFTKVNPAYMTRQIAELVRERGNIAFNITSLKPIRPQNAADAWEVSALQRFERGEREVLEYLANGEGGVFRYMAALVTEEPCLNCHRRQGYKLGDIRGGISVTIPGAQVLAELAPQKRQVILLHGLVFVVLAGMTFLLLDRLRAHWLALAAAKAEQEQVVAERTAELRAANHSLSAEAEERARVTARLEEAVAELRRSNEELEQFAYVASHDLQEPLRMITGYAQLLHRRHADKLDGDAAEFLGFMTDGAKRMNAMIADLLAYARVDRGQSKDEVVHLDEAVLSALGNLHSAIIETHAMVEHDPLPVVAGNRAQLGRLMQNLIGNAIKYRHPDRLPEVQVGGRRDGAHWLVWIKDNGIGIPPEHAQRVFMIFQRLHSREDYPGTGIGLAICKKIIERHGGRIWVESSPGKGSTFFFTLPASEAE